MKIIHKTRKYLHVRMTQEEYDLLQKSLNKVEAEKKEEERKIAYAEWFFINHVEIVWEDEYGSRHTDWKNIHTGDYVQDPGFWVTLYRGRFVDVIKKNKESYSKGNMP